MTLTNKQKGILMLLGMLLLLLIAGILLFMPGRSQGEEKNSIQEENIEQVIPDAENDEVSASKMDGYARSQAGAYWDSLSDDDAPTLETAEESARNTTGSRNTGSSNAPQYTAQDIINASQFQDEQQTPEVKPRAAAPSASGSKNQSSQGTKKTEYTAPATYDESGSAGEQEKPREQIRTRNAESISGFDDDADGPDGSVTSMDTGHYTIHEEGHPYKCMFTKSEKVKAGQRVSIRLMEDIVVAGVHIPRNTHLQATVGISQRLDIHISALNYNGKIITLNLDGYDIDGAKGIYCSGLNEDAKMAADQATSTANSLLSPVIGSTVGRDVATLGFSVLRNKQGEITIQVPAGYSFYLIENIEGR